MVSSKAALLVVVLACRAVTAATPSYFFFSNQTNSLFSTVSAGCNTALTAPILQCPKELLNLLGGADYYTVQNDTVMDVLCNTACPTAFQNYRTNVTAACAHDPQPMPGYPVTYWVDAASSAFTQACLKDSKTGVYCTDFLNATLGDATDPSAVLGGYNATTLCSECVVNLFKHQQSTPYSNYDLGSSQAWASIQSHCGLSFPTATPTLQTNVTSLGNYAPAGYATASCVSGRTYKVVSGDNCNAIAQNNQVSTGALIALNSLFTSCTNIFVGQSLCLPAPCTSYLVQNGDTCVGIAKKASTSFQQVISWNPTIDSYCTNLIAGQNICVGPPGGFQNFSTIAGATVTQTAQYATSTASRPNPVASGTTSKCGKYYLVQPGDFCQLVALNSTIPVSLFEAINPQIDAACDNLLAGVYYCVMPTQDWNTTASSTTVPAPTTTPPGTTSNCYQYYVVQSGDYCAKIEDQFVITFAQLQQWNPSLLNDCSNLQLGEAYCVNGASSAATTKAGTSSTAKKRRDELYPQKTPAPVAGGVPVGWPGLKSPRLMAAMGLLGSRDEL